MTFTIRFIVNIREYKLGVNKISTKYFKLLQCFSLNFSQKIIKLLKNILNEISF